LSKPLDLQSAGRTVMEFLPPQIDRQVPKQALDSYQRQKEKGSSFHISDVVREQTGLDKIEDAKYEAQIEQKVLERLQQVQQASYQEAYQLGLEEGRKDAFRQAAPFIDTKTKELSEVIDSMLMIKTHLLAQNERHIVELAFHIGQKLAAHEVSINPEATLNIVREAIRIAQSEEKITLQIHPGQIEYFETLTKETAREFEFLKKVKLEPSEQIGLGGCVVISNYGEVDSRIAVRVEQLWKELEEALPRAKDQMSVG